MSWARGERLVYEANPAYWRGAPKTARLDLRIVPDPGTNFTLLQSGALDWNLLSPSQRASLGTPAHLRFRTVPLALVAGIAINTTHPPFDDVRVRRAIAASIDREAISKKITFGRYPVVDTAQPLGSWARDPGVREPAYDPRAADALLDAAGWKRGPDGVRVKNGKRLALTYVQFPESQTGVRVSVVAQSELNARGFAVTIKSLSNAQLFLPKSQGGALASGAFDLAYVPWPMGADPDDSFLLSCKGNANYMRWCDPRRRRAGAARAGRAEPHRAQAPVRADRAAGRRTRCRSCTCSTRRTRTRTATRWAASTPTPSTRPGTPTAGRRDLRYGRADPIRLPLRARRAPVLRVLPGDDARQERGPLLAALQGAHAGRGDRADRLGPAALRRDPLAGVRCWRWSRWR